ncbi:mariner Mos1 transposase [Trichonephila clavipes]|nr:mariner Mos1 transposase [Trichonephila clavipes]
MLVEAYGGNALSRAHSYRWFEKFQNGDFDVRNEERGRPAKKFEDAELQALLDEYDGQTQEHLAEQLNVDQSTVSRRLKTMGKIIKVGICVPYELTDRQQENQETVCEMLLARYKRMSYLHRIVTGDEKFIYFENPKRNRSYVDPRQPSKSTTRPNRFGRKTMLCIFWD